MIIYSCSIKKYMRHMQIYPQGHSRAPSPSVCTTSHDVPERLKKWECAAVPLRPGGIWTSSLLVGWFWRQLVEHDTVELETEFAPFIWWWSGVDSISGAKGTIIMSTSGEDLLIFDKQQKVAVQLGLVWFHNIYIHKYAGFGGRGRPLFMLLEQCACMPYYSISLDGIGLVLQPWQGHKGTQAWAF